MRILHVIPGLAHERGGPSAVLTALARHQSEAGHAVVVLTTNQGTRWGEHPPELPAAVTLERAAVLGPDRLAYAPRFVALARRLVRACDIVHVHSIFTYPVHAALREALAAGVPVVLRPCGQLHRYSLRRSAGRKWLYRTIWGRMVRRAAMAWHYTSANEAEQSWPYAPVPHFILPNGIEPDEFAVDREEAQRTVAQLWPEIGHSPYVLFLGRLDPKKRLDLLLEAFQTGAPPGFKLVVAGPDEGGLWKRLAARFPDAAGRAVPVGTVSGNAKGALLAGARLFALPSEHENFGIAALEALAAGTPVLLSPHVDFGAAAVAVGLGHTAPLEVEAWRRQLVTLLAEGWSAALTQRARCWVAEHYAWNRIAEELVERYREVLAGHVAIAPERAPAPVAP